MEIAVLNDIIYTKVKYPSKRTLRVKLTTQESVDYANRVALNNDWHIQGMTKIQK